MFAVYPQSRPWKSPDVKALLDTVDKLNANVFLAHCLRLAVYAIIDRAVYSAVTSSLLFSKKREETEPAYSKILHKS